MLVLGNIWIYFLYFFCQPEEKSVQKVILIVERISFFCIFPQKAGRKAYPTKVVFILTEDLLMGRGVWESPMGNRLTFQTGGYWRVGIIVLYTGGEVS